MCGAGLVICLLVLVIGVAFAMFVVVCGGDLAIVCGFVSYVVCFVILCFDYWLVVGCCLLCLVL